MFKNIFFPRFGQLFLHSYKKKFAAYNRHGDFAPQIVKSNIFTLQIIRQDENRFFYVFSNFEFYFFFFCYYDVVIRQTLMRRMPLTLAKITSNIGACLIT